MKYDPRMSQEKTDGLEALRGSLEQQPTEELISILRNHDEEQWRPEVFPIVESILAARGVSPEEVEAEGPEGKDVLESQELVAIERFFTPVEAQTHRMALEEAGIPAWVTDETISSGYGVGVGARLLVRATDVEAAQSVLEAAPVPASALPPELAEPPCPKCGSMNVTSAQEDDRDWRYECNACGQRWSD
jgi:hypothetical protein